MKKRDWFSIMLQKQKLALLFCLLPIAVKADVATMTGFDPFMDSNLFSINWNGALEMTKDEVFFLSIL